MNEELNNKIDAYFKHALSKAESDAFERDIQNNPELSRLMDEYRLAMDVIDQQQENELRLKFSSWKQDEKQVVVRSITPYLAIAASILILVGLYIFYDKSKPATYTQIALQYYNLPGSPEYSMGLEQIHWQKGIELYTNKDFKQAAHEWVQITDANPEVKYYLAHCYFNLKEYNQATSLFKELSEGTSVYSYPSDWYIVLSLLSNGDIEQATDVIEKIIAAKEHPYYSQTSDLKAKIK